MPKLSEEDQDKVERYLGLPQHQRERPSFKPLRLLLYLLLALIVITLISYAIAAYQGLI